MIPVTLKIRWSELFGEPGEIQSDERKKRWEEWKKISIESGRRGKEMVKYWSKDNVDETCNGCIHREGDWCAYAGLPCNVNPVLTFQNNMIGMACAGVGYEAKQPTLF